MTTQEEAAWADLCTPMGYWICNRCDKEVHGLGTQENIEPRDVDGECLCITCALAKQAEQRKREEAYWDALEHADDTVLTGVWAWINKMLRGAI